VIVEAFLQWMETAKTKDRVRAASALGRACIQTSMPTKERVAAEMAMVYLLDDPSPQVRLSLAEAICHSDTAPRNVILSLAEDQPEIAGQVIIASPVFSDVDLVDLAARGSESTRILIASRGQVTPAVSAALGEVGGEDAILCLLENEGAVVPRGCLRRIASRYGDNAEVRSLLLDRGDLPSDARHMLMQQVSDALCGFSLVKAAVGSERLRRIARDATRTGTVAIAGAVPQDDMPDLVEHLRQSDQITPAFLMHALCSGKIDFFAAAIVALSGCEERRVQSIIGNGRMHAMRALYEAAGLPRDISTVFVEATLLWRSASRAATGSMLETVSLRLIAAFGRKRGPTGAAVELMDMVEKLHLAEQRQVARHFATSVSLVAA
jgi:uncharacterized protein (DUF2336 family)